MSVQFTDTNSPTQLQGKLFSPTQIIGGTILGGVASGAYFMAKNYEAIGDIKKRNMTYMLGLFFTIAVVAIVIYFDVKFSGSAFSGALAAGLSVYTKSIFKENQISTVGTFFPSIEKRENQHSNWHVLGAIIGGIIVGLIVSIIAALTFTAIGFGHP